MTEWSMTIGGEAVTAKETFDVVNPARGEVFATAPECTEKQLDTAFAAAAAAQPGWARDRRRRQVILRALAAVVEESVDELAAILTTEQGKPLREAVAEVRGVARWFSYYADLELEPEILKDDRRKRVQVVRRPIGVVAAITPWNFPLQLAAMKLAPALAAGNAVVLKPSPYTPLATLRFGELLRGVLPDGVLNVVSGGDQLGAWMTRHPVPRKISFTGSVAGGKQVAGAAAHDLKRVTLELGGNDPAILLDDVDVESVADSLFWSAFMNNGQVCAAIKRVYAPEHIYRDVVDALAARAAKAIVGDPTDPGTQLGPVNNAPQLDRVTALLADAVSNGGRVAVGGDRIDQPGYFLSPAVVADVDDRIGLVAQEQFGPALPIVPYRSVEEAVARANGTTYGLTASVWGGDVERAAEIAAALESGTTFVNAHLVSSPYQPTGGLKWSGIGVEGGRWGLESYTEVQVAYLAKASR